MPATDLRPLFAAAGLPEPVPEYRFAPPRRWRADFAWPAYQVALEVEGGVWTGGRHVRGSGFIKDLEKYNRLAAMGFLLVRCTPKMLASGEAFSAVEDALRARGWEG